MQKTAYPTFPWLSRAIEFTLRTSMPSRPPMRSAACPRSVVFMVFAKISDSDCPVYSATTIKCHLGPAARIIHHHMVCGNCQSHVVSSDGSNTILVAGKQVNCETYEMNGEYFLC